MFVHYFVIIKRRGEIREFKDSYLPGFIPERVIDMMTHDSAETLGLCEKCDRDSYCHVMQEIGPDTYRHLCPILFCDTFKPPWRVEQLV